VKPEPAAVEPKLVVTETRAEPTETPAPKAEARKPTAAAAEEGPFWVQVLVTKSPQKADGLSKKLKADGFKPDVSLVPGKQGLFRVRVGPYTDRTKAEAGARKVEKLEKLETTIVASGK
jgi:cell division septation protein DedD